MLNKSKNITSLTLGLLCLVLAISCKKDFKVDPFTPSRMFLPGDISIIAGETSAELSWNPSLFSQGRNATYTVEVSTDPNFAGSPVFSDVTDSARITLTDAQVSIKTNLYARVKTNTTGSSAESGWISSSAFQISGEQIFSPVNDAELFDNRVTLRWRPYPGLTRLVLTPASGTAIDIALTADDVTAASRLVEGLDPVTNYTAEIFQGALSKGLVSFRTKEPSIYTITLNDGGDLLEAVTNAANGDVIGLNPGNYEIKNGAGTFVNLILEQKSVSIVSVSNVPATTKIHFKEIVLKGSGAGVHFEGIEFDGAASTASGQQALYLINLVGMSSEGEPATFGDLEFNNCIIRNIGNCLMRANRAADNAHKIGLIKLNNVQVYNSATINSNYGLFTINKLEFARIEITNSTFYKSGRAFIDWSATITVTPRPVVLVDQCTVNTLGMQNGNKNIVFDANGSLVDLTIRNSIFANTPYPGETSQAAAIRLGAASTAIFNNNNTFRFTSGGPTPAALTFPAAVSLQNNQSVDLGWTDATTDFTLPAGSPLRTASTTNGPVGDPRWAN